MNDKYFMHRIKRTNNTYDKGVEVKDSLDAAKQSYYAYLGAYGYGRDASTDFVSCFITDMTGYVVQKETWQLGVNPDE